MQGATVVDLVFGAACVRTRQVVPLLVAHTAFDPVALIYFEWEEAVARALFR